jgi:hypothetical protein
VPGFASRLSTTTGTPYSDPNGGSAPVSESLNSEVNSASLIRRTENTPSAVASRSTSMTSAAGNTAIIGSPSASISTDLATRWPETWTAAASSWAVTARGCGRTANRMCEPFR